MKRTVFGFTVAALLAGNASAVDLLFEGFEAAPQFTTSVPQFTDNARDFFTVTDGSNIASTYQVTGFAGSNYFAAMDLDGETPSATQTLSFAGVDINGFTDLQFSILLAEDDEGPNQDWDADTSFLIEYQIDGGGFQNLLAVESTGATDTEPAIDINFDGVGDFPSLAPEFFQFNAAILGTGSALDLRLTFTQFNASEEDIAIDNIIISGTPVPEPSSLALLGLSGLLLVRRRR